jgi:hypothetical protein
MSAKGDRQVLSEGAFEAMGARLVGGRWFTDADTTASAPVADERHNGVTGIIKEKFFFPHNQWPAVTNGGDPIRSVYLVVRPAARSGHVRRGGSDAAPRRARRERRAGVAGDESVADDRAAVLIPVRSWAAAATVAQRPDSTSSTRRIIRRCHGPNARSRVSRSTANRASSVRGVWARGSRCCPLKKSSSSTH